jgi:uroporphyrinogen-III synthase/uroporphyrinogen III methyltransferase/synthase
MNCDILTAKRILVTRAAHQAGKLSDALRELGANPVEVPVLEIQPPGDLGPLEKAIRRFDTYDWVILTSANAVKAVVECSAAMGVAFDQAALPQVAAVGAATAGAARNAGLSVALVPENYVAESLVEAIAGQVLGKRILIARAAIARDVIPDALRAAGAIVNVVDAYRSVVPETAPELLRAALELGIDAVTFTSSSSVTHLDEAANAAGIAFPFAGVAAISIGPITSQTLREYGWEPAAEAKPSDIPGLVSALANYFGSV